MITPSSLDSNHQKIIVNTLVSAVTGEQPFLPLYNLGPDINTVVCIGGRGGAKTYEVSKFIAFSATIKKKRCVVLRDEQSKIRQSILNEILLRYDTANEYGGLDKYYQKQETGIKDKKTSQDLVFTMGFRMSSNEKRAGLKSVSDVDIAVIEEAEDIRDVSKFNSFADSIRKQGYLIIIILNTPDIHHWIIQRYFTYEPVGEQEDGYFAIIPKKIPGFLCIQTSFEDNANNLPANKVAEYRGYGNPEHHLYDIHHYLTDIKGYASTGRKGQVFKKVKRISLAEYLELPYREIFGLDFGTASPAGMVGVKMHGDFLWARELNYLPMEILDIGKFFCRLGLKADDVIVADSAKPLDITRLRSGWEANELSEEDLRLYPGLITGFTIYGVVKAPGSIESGNSALNSLQLFITDDSVNFWLEVINYVYSQDKWGQYHGIPIDDFNHLWDPTRYVAVSKGRFF